MTTSPREMTVAMEGLEGGRFWTDRISQDAAARSQAFTVPADETRTVRAYVVAPAGSSQQDFTFTLATDDQQPETASGTTRFSAPESE